MNLDFESDIKHLIKAEPEGCVIFDISLRGGSIETDIVRFAEQYGYDPKWTQEEKAIIKNEKSPDHYIKGIYDESLNAEDWLNEQLEELEITGYSFVRFSESEIWGLFPQSAIDEYYGVD